MRTCLKVTVPIDILFIIASLICLIIFSVEVNNKTIKIKADENNIYKCYDEKRIKNDGSIHHFCDNPVLINTTFSSISDILNKDCDKKCPDIKCIENTKILIASLSDTNKCSANIIKFEECYPSYLKTFFEYKCVGAEKCGFYKNYDRSTYFLLIAISIIIFIAGSLYLVLAYKTYLDDKKSNSFQK